MAFSTFNSIINGYHDLMDRQSDDRVKEWPLMGSPFPTLFMCISYAYIVKYAGPKFMEKRNPYDLRKFLFCYNVFQVLFNGWLFCEGLTRWVGMGYSLQCQPIDYSRSPEPVRVATLCWWYYICKLTEFCDTFSFVLRKKNGHISNLHVIHHGVMPMSVWFGVKFIPGGHSTFFGLLNTGVHVVMYSYYLLATFGPRVQRFLWWKRYVTSLQMFHFVIIMGHSFQLLFQDCEFPRFFMWWIGLHAVMFYAFFTEFYKQQYGRSPPLNAFFEKKIKLRSQ
ncbi:elongation of very long chain fatty acids protein AAEL008004-like [Ischnura elegans]|uniref:elongation of very long chain fatty acids protein AAEL008004-like n=1 Tax=Ischnura elegans TaxID=197161 RepID=UPI001ED8AEA0|nr:elongation of very long chain fatty acids protein AAEL008004-like [Ischnura elegans]